MVSVIDDLEKRFLYQLQENDNQPLEINKELEKDLQELLTIVFISEVESNQQTFISQFAERILVRASKYTKNNILKAVTKFPE